MCTFWHRRRGDVGPVSRSLHMREFIFNIAEEVHELLIPVLHVGVLHDSRFG